MSIGIGRRKTPRRVCCQGFRLRSSFNQPAEILNTEIFLNAEAEEALAAAAAGDERIATAQGCCAWCSRIAGRYDYEDVRDKGNDVFRRHERCRCTVDYVCDGNRQDVWSKKYFAADEETMQKRASYGLERREETERRVAERERKQEELKKQKEEAYAEMEKKYARKTTSEEKTLDRNNSANTIKHKGEPSGSQLFSKNAQKELYQKERILAGNRYETGILFDKDGKQVFLKKGTSDEVKFTAKEIKQMKGGVLTHNHPNWSCFSPHDINMARRGKLAEIRAAVNDGTFVFRPGGGTWEEEVSTLKGIEKKLSEIEDSIADRCKDIAAQEGMTQYQYLRYLDDQTMRTFCSQYGFEYAWESKAESEFFK